MCGVMLLRQALRGFAVLLLYTFVGLAVSLLFLWRPPALPAVSFGQQQQTEQPVVRKLPLPSEQCKVQVLDLKLWPRSSPSPYGVIAEATHVDWTLSNASNYPLKLPIDFGDKTQLRALAAREVLGLVPPTSTRGQQWWHPRLPTLSATRYAQRLWLQGRLVPVSVLVELDADAMQKFREPTPDFSFFRGCQLTVRGRPIGEAVSWTAFNSRNSGWKLGRAFRVQAQVMCVFEKTAWNNFVTASRQDERGTAGYTLTIQHGNKSEFHHYEPVLDIPVRNIINPLENEVVDLGLDCRENCIVALSPKVYGERVPQEVAHWLKSVLSVSKLDGAILGVITSHLSIEYVRNQLCDHLGQDCCKILAKTRFLPVHTPAIGGAVYGFGDPFIGSHLLPALARAARTVVFGDWDELLEIPRENGLTFTKKSKHVPRALITATSQSEIEKCSLALVDPASVVRIVLDSSLRRGFILKWLAQFGCVTYSRGKMSWKPEEMIMFHNHADDVYREAWRRRGVDAVRRLDDNETSLIKATREAAKHNARHNLLPASWLELHMRLKTLSSGSTDQARASAYTRLREWYTKPENAWKDNPGGETRRAVDLLLKRPDFEPMMWHARVVKDSGVGGATLRGERVGVWQRMQRDALVQRQEQNVTEEVDIDAVVPFPASLVVTGNLECDQETACACSCVEFLRLAQRIHSLKEHKEANDKDDDIFGKPVS
ncbi:MAG: hypothetical protein MHM6MM_000228 [Cercozoa sp. M6MM]